MSQNLDRSEEVSYEGGRTGNSEAQAEGTDRAKALRQAAALKLKQNLIQFSYSCDRTKPAGHSELYPDVRSSSFAVVDSHFPVGVSLGDGVLVTNSGLQ